MDVNIQLKVKYYIRKKFITITMAYKLRVILDTEEDVFRDIIVDSSFNLENLHFIIAKAFGFNGKEMASFYKTDKNWNEGEEIPLFGMEENSTTCMQDFTIQNCIAKVGDKLIYVYDFLNLWTFFVELKEVLEEKEVPKISLSFGNTPEKAPDKFFKSVPFKEGLFDNLDSFDNFDELEY